MQNQDMYIPPHLQEQWDAATRELGEASLELQRANTRYYEAIKARIAIAETVNREK